jgi:hypothetical protein
MNGFKLFLQSYVLALKNFFTFMIPGTICVLASWTIDNTIIKTKFTRFIKLIQNTKLDATTIFNSANSFINTPLKILLILIFPFALIKLYKLANSLITKKTNATKTSLTFTKYVSIGFFALLLPVIQVVAPELIPVNALIPLSIALCIFLFFILMLENFFIHNLVNNKYSIKKSMITSFGMIDRNLTKYLAAFLAIILLVIIEMILSSLLFKTLLSIVKIFSINITIAAMASIYTLVTFFGVLMTVATIIFAVKVCKLDEKQTKK